MPLPRRVETLEQVKARFPKALERDWDAEAIKQNLEKGTVILRPGMVRANVFDLPDGLRMIASREHDASGLFIHLSFSGDPAASPTRTAAQWEERVHELAFMFCGSRRLIREGFTPVAWHMMFAAD